MATGLKTVASKERSADATIVHGTNKEPSWFKQPVWNRFTPLQLIVLGLATIAPLVIVATITAGLLGAISVETMITVVLGAGENPGMITFGAMFLATPVRLITGRSQIRVRKYLGIVFFLLALSNGAMFVIDAGLTAVLGAPFLIAGTIGLALALPLFLTSSHRAQRFMGIRRWRTLHKLTYLVAALLLAHVVLLGDVGPGALMIAIGFASRIPAVRRRLKSVGDRRRYIRAGSRLTAPREATAPPSAN